jgi:hypothetical protein
MFIQITLFNDIDCENHQTIYIKWQQVKVEWGICRRGGERQREPIKGVRDRA